MTVVSHDFCFYRIQRNNKMDNRKETLNFLECRALGKSLLRKALKGDLKGEDIKALGFLNASAYKEGSDFNKDPEKIKLNKLVYHYKMRVLDIVLRHYINKFPIYRDIEGNVLLIYVGKVQVSFHLNRDYTTDPIVDYRSVDNLHFKAWEKVLRSYRYDEESYLKVKEISENLTFPELLELDRNGKEIPEYVKKLIEEEN